MLYSQKVILNGLYIAFGNSFTISISPPSIYGAIKRANHITGIIPIIYKTVFVLLLSVMSCFFSPK